MQSLFSQFSHNDYGPQKFQEDEEIVTPATRSLLSCTVRVALHSFILHENTNTRGNIGSVRTTPEKFENAALLFLRLGQSCTLIRYENGALETPAFSFSVDEKYFENETFRKRLRHDNQ